ncbi:MAG TPA: methyltransferase [Methylophilaceae bacterium]|nr:methyltransferase [Methylophilaceae bacterium]
MTTREKQRESNNLAGLNIPTIPNAPLLTPEDKTHFGTLTLKKNKLLGLYVNSTYEEELTVYDNTYQNNQSHSLAFKKHLSEVYSIFKKQFNINSKIVDVGCGKGDFVNLLNSESYFDAIGFDTTYEGDSARIHKRYLNDTDKINANVIVLRHVLEYVPSPHTFLELLYKIFGNVDIYIEQPNFDYTVNEQVFTDITYERVNYFTKKSLKNLFTKSESGNLFNNQYQYVIANLENLSHKYNAEFSNRDNWIDIEFYSLFSKLHLKIKEINILVEQSNNTFIWGASTKGCMFLHHYLNLIKSTEKIKFAIDINSSKFDKFLPSSYIPIKSDEFFYKNVSDNDLVIISNLNYEIEIKKDITINSDKKIRVITL